MFSNFKKHIFTDLTWKVLKSINLQKQDYFWTTNFYQTNQNFTFKLVVNSRWIFWTRLSQKFWTRLIQRLRSRLKRNPKLIGCDLLGGIGGGWSTWIICLLISEVLKTNLKSDHASTFDGNQMYFIACLHFDVTLELKFEKMIKIGI